MTTKILHTIENFFQLSRHNTSWRVELLAGCTTFLTMAYILFVNPQILSTTGMDITAVFIATALASCIGCFLMALLANYPIAIAPGMGLNAYFTYTIVHHYGYSWQTALGATLIAGVLFILISASKIRKTIIQAIPHSLAIGISVGIGLFLIVISLENCNIMNAQANSFHFGTLHSYAALFFLCGLTMIVILESLRIRAAIILSILCITIASIIIGINQYQGIISLPHGLEKTALAFNFHSLLSSNGLAVILSIVIVMLFDNTGTLIGVLRRTHLTHNSEADTERLSRALLADSIAACSAGCLGSSTTTTYIESASGIRAGGRTGLTAVVVGLLFLTAIFFSPLIKTIPSYAVAPALFYVGCVMFKHITQLEWREITEWIPAIFIIITIPLTFSIANGIGAGFISYFIFKALRGKIRSVHWLLTLLTAIFAIYFIYLFISNK